MRGRTPAASPPAAGVRPLPPLRLLLLPLTASAAAGGGPPPLPPPVNGSTLWEFCGGKFSRCSGGMGNWWSPSSARQGGALLVAALGKSSTSTLHATPTFVELRRSTDGGETFDPPVPVLGPSSCNQYTGCADPANATSFNGGTLVVCEETRTLHLLFSAGMSPSPSKAHPTDGTGGNLSIISSADMGASWSEARPVMNARGDRILSSGQVNNGIQLKHAYKGRLVVPREVFFGPKPPTDPDSPGGFENKAGVVFSDDGGATWEAGAFLPPEAWPSGGWRQEEPAVAELANGSVVITCRNGQNRSSPDLCGGGEVCRVFARSDDGGATWARQWHVPVTALPAHRCEAAMAGASLDGHGAGVLLFGAPMNMTTGDRTNYTIYASTDGGDTWAWGAAVDGGAAGYSSLAVLGAEPLADGSWRVDVGASFQAGHDIHGVEGGGYDMAFARRSVVVGAP